MLPQRNAYLTRVERFGGTAGGGFSEDYDRPATDPEGDAEPGGDDLFIGKVGVYYVEARERVRTAGGSDRILRRSVTLEPRIIGVDFEEGDTVTVLHGDVVKNGKVKTIERRSMPGVRPTTRLTFEDG